jgi:hypothetical protein
MSVARPFIVSVSVLSNRAWMQRCIGADALVGERANWMGRLKPTCSRWLTLGLLPSTHRAGALVVALAGR